jgi:DNA-binding NtrC family response regulator
MAHAIIREHGGAIMAESTEGAGTTFNFILPITDQPVQDPNRPRRGPTPRGTELVLVADDDQMVLEMVSTALSMHGYKVLTAKNGQETVALFKQYGTEIRLALVDQTMPRLSQREVASELHDLAPRTPIIITSGYGPDQSLFDAAGNRPLAFISKPYPLPELLRMIRELIDSSRDESMDSI